MNTSKTDDGTLLKSTDLFAGFDPEEHELLKMDGYDDCIAGVVERFGQNPIVCYDKEKVLCRLESYGMDRDEAEEFFYFNQIGAWMGDSTPCFLSANVQAVSAAELISKHLTALRKLYDAEAVETSDLFAAFGSRGWPGAPRRRSRPDRILALI